MFSNLTKQNSTANSYLPDFAIDGIEVEEAPTSKAEDEKLLLSFVEEHHRVMGYGLVSNVFTSFLASEVGHAA
jgi:hypothetical protein